MRPPTICTQVDASSPSTITVRAPGLPVEEDDVGAGRHQVDVQRQPPPVVGDDGHGQGRLVEARRRGGARRRPGRRPPGATTPTPSSPPRPRGRWRGRAGGRRRRRSRPAATPATGGGRGGWRRAGACRCRPRRCAGCRARCRPRTPRRPAAGRRATGENQSMEAAWSAARPWGSTTTRAGASGSTALRMTRTAWSASPSRWRWKTRSPATAGDPTTPIWSSSSRRWWSGSRWRERVEDRPGAGVLGRHPGGGLLAVAVLQPPVGVVDLGAVQDLDDVPDGRRRAPAVRLERALPTGVGPLAVVGLLAPAADLPLVRLLRHQAARLAGRPVSPPDPARAGGGGCCVFYSAR